MAEYVVFKKGKQMPQLQQSRADMLERADLFLSKDGAYRSHIKGKEPQKKFRSGLLQKLRVRNLTRKAPLGSRILAERANDETLVIAKVERDVVGPVPDLGAHPSINQAHAYLWNKYGDGVRSGGRWYCKFVSGTNTVSRHGYYGKNWKGAAEDIFGVGNLNNMASLYAIAEDLVQQVKKGVLDLDTVIVGDKRWRRGIGWDHYGGEFHTHIHIDIAAGRACTP